MKKRHNPPEGNPSMFLPNDPHVGFQFKSRGWTIEVKGDREVAVSDPTQGFCDMAHVEQDGTINYTKAELVPRDVRTAVKILGRRMLARDLQV